MLKWVALPKWKVPSRQFGSFHCTQFKILDRTASDASLFRDCIKELFTLESNADTACAVREYSPVVVRFRGSGKAEGQNGLESVPFLIKLKKIRIILVVPSFWIQERDSLLAQQTNEGWDIGVAPKVFF